MFRTFSLAVALASASTVAIAADSTAPSNNPAAEKKVCKSDKATGSIMIKRTCRTKAEWAALEQRSQSDLARTQSMERSRGMVGSSREN